MAAGGYHGRMRRFFCPPQPVPGSASRCLRIVLLVCLGLLGAGCSEPAPLQDVRFPAMGTLVRLRVAAPASPALDATLAGVEAELVAFGHDWWAWGDGALGELNRNLAEAPCVPMPPAMAPLLRRSMTLATASGGRFQPLVGPLVRLWQFHAAPRPLAPAPSAAAIAALLPLPAPTTVAVRDTHLCAPPGSWIDLGGIAKGEAVRRAAARLQAAGLGDAVVEAGGDLVALGRRHGQPWRIGIADPRGPGVLGELHLTGGLAAFTSGDYERTFTEGGRRYHHILDPATGYPVAGVRGVTVVDPDPVLADAAATALFVAGDADWPAVAAMLGVRAVLRVTAAGRLEATPAMLAYLRLPAGEEPVRVELPAPAASANR